MSEDFFKRPTIMSSCELSTRQWQREGAAQPINGLIVARREWQLTTAVLKLAVRSGRRDCSDRQQPRMLFDSGDERRHLSATELGHSPPRIIIEIQPRVVAWWRLHMAWGAAL
jgi:hypothetical protein